MRGLSSVDGGGQRPRRLREQHTSRATRVREDSAQPKAGREEGAESMSEEAQQQSEPRAELEAQAALAETKIFVGRTLEIAQIGRALLPGSNVVVKGRAGIGKRSLLAQVRASIADQRVCLYASTGTAKQFAAELAEQVHDAVGLSVPERLIPTRFRAAAASTGTVPFRHIKRSPESRASSRSARPAPGIAGGQAGCGAVRRFTRGAADPGGHDLGADRALPVVRRDGGYQPPSAHRPAVVEGASADGLQAAAAGARRASGWRPGLLRIRSHSIRRACALGVPARHRARLGRASPPLCRACST